MKHKPNVPEEIGWGKPYSWRAATKAGGGWMLLAFLTDLPGISFLEHHKDWPLAVRVVIALIPLLASWLYVRGAARWIRGMDELHRRIALESFLFALVAYLFLGAAWFLLNETGVWSAMAQATGLHLERMPFLTCTLILCLTYVFFGISHSIVNRRYQ